MNPETRQTLIGVSGLTVVEIAALIEGFNGRVTMAFMVAVVALIAPQALEKLPMLGGGGGT